MGSRPSTRSTTPARARERKQAKFLEVLRTGLSVTAAAEAAGVDRTTVYNWRGKDEKFAQRWDAAVEAGTDKIEDEAYRRAVEGIITTRYTKNGDEYTTINYSDRLLEILLKSRRPERYRERYDVETTGETKIVVDLRLREPEDDQGQE